MLRMCVLVYICMHVCENAIVCEGVLFINILFYFFLEGWDVGEIWRGATRKSRIHEGGIECKRLRTTRLSRGMSGTHTHTLILWTYVFIPNGVVLNIPPPGYTSLASLVSFSNPHPSFPYNTQYLFFIPLLAPSSAIHGSSPSWQCGIQKITKKFLNQEKASDEWETNNMQRHFCQTRLTRGGYWMC